MIKEKKDMRPLLVKLGVALAVSIAGFVYSRLKTRQTRFNQPPCSPRSSGRSSEGNGGGRSWCIDDLHKMKKTHSSSSIALISTEIQEDSYVIKETDDNSKSLLSPSSKENTNKDGFLLPEFDDFVREFDLAISNAGGSPKRDEDTPSSDVGIPRAFTSKDKDDYEEEIRHLKHRVRVLMERERKLEGQLLEFYGLKEQETTVMELQNRLKIHNVEAKFLSLKIESLQRENRKLQEQVEDHAKIVAELDAARTNIELLKKKLRAESEYNREQLTTLQRRVSSLLEQEVKAATTDSEIQSSLQRLKDLETEAEELRKLNLTLQQENSELARKLESTQIIANTVLEDPEAQVLREHSNRLRQENQDLEKAIEQLQLDRCADCEELVYLRWINACLRYELRNFQPPHGKTVARDLSRSLSPKSEEKAKRLILEYASTTEGQGDKGINNTNFESDLWFSSQSTYFTDPGDFDDSSLSTKANSSSKMKFFNKLRRVLQGKDIHHDTHGLSEDKTGGVEDSDSDHGGLSSSTMTSDLQSNKSRTLSMNSSRQSMDFQRPRSTETDDLKDLGKIQRNSTDVASSSSAYYTHRRFSSRWRSTSDISQENQTDRELHLNEKSELVKFAEALKGSEQISRSTHRKAVSLGSLEAFRHVGSE